MLGAALQQVQSEHFGKVPAKGLVVLGELTPSLRPVWLISVPWTASSKTRVAKEANLCMLSACRELALTSYLFKHRVYTRVELRSIPMLKERQSQWMNIWKDLIFGQFFLPGELIYETPHISFCKRPTGRKKVVVYRQIFSVHESVSALVLAFSFSSYLSETVEQCWGL